MSNRLQHHEELIVELYPHSSTNMERLRVWYCEHGSEDELERGWYYQFASDPLDIGNEPIGPYKTAKQAYEDARESIDYDDDAIVPAWRTLKNRGWC